MPAPAVIRHFCTYFDQYFLARGLALYESLRQHCPGFQLWVLCLDDFTWELLSALRLPALRLIALAEFERRNPDLLKVKANRNRLEYYFTCSPVLPAHVFDTAPEVEQVTYLDADLCFFTNPEPIFSAMADKSIAILGHHYSEVNRHFADSAGIYNVSWLSFRRNPEAFDCLTRWRKKCLEWCYDWADAGRNADQKYLDPWPQQYRGLVVIPQIGAGVAPWNVDQYRLSQTAGQLSVDGEPLYFYHFAGLSQVNPWVYNPNLSHFQARLTAPLKEWVYTPYILLLHALQAVLYPGQSTAKSFASVRPEIYRTASPVEYSRWHSRVRRVAGACKWVLKGRYIFIPRIHANALQLCKGLAQRYQP